jgi:hypothetical protein
MILCGRKKRGTAYEKVRLIPLLELMGDEKQKNG